jgi:hypothetical protein
MSDFNIKVPASVTQLELNVYQVLASLADYCRGPGFEPSDVAVLEDLVQRIKRVKGNQNIVGSGNKVV